MDENTFTAESLFRTLATQNLDIDDPKLEQTRHFIGAMGLDPTDTELLAGAQRFQGMIFTAAPGVPFPPDGETGVVRAMKDTANQISNLLETGDIGIALDTIEAETKMVVPKELETLITDYYTSPDTTPPAARDPAPEADTLAPLPKNFI